MSHPHDRLLPDGGGEGEERVTYRYECRKRIRKRVRKGRNGRKDYKNIRIGLEKGL